jgi:predicted TIM-barrel fold metal-dependent hydrolase
MDLAFVDSQIHIWNVDHPEAIPRHGDKPLRMQDALAEMNAAGVGSAVLVPPYWMEFDNSYALYAAQIHPSRFGVMGRFDITAEPSADRLITEFQKPGMLGFRLHFNDAKMLPFLNDYSGDWFWEAATTANIPIMLFAPGMLDGIGRVAQSFPKLSLAIDHMGIGRGLRDDDAFAHWPKLLELSRFSNVSIKLSTVPIFSTHPYPYLNLHPYLKSIYEKFGRERLFWGSDLSRLPCSYRLSMDLFLNELPWLSEQDLRAIMGRSLSNWLNWPFCKSQFLKSAV